MPIRLPEALPAIKILEQENIFVMAEQRALQQDIRPLEILILNIMPKKSETETQLLRLLSNTPLQLNVEFLCMASHEGKNTAPEYLERFYKNFADIRHKRYDGLIITGAPVEQLPFEAVDYWPEMVEVMEWSRSHVFSTVHICWGAQAGLYHHYGVPKLLLAHKLAGIYEHVVRQPANVLFRGFDDTFFAPHSRYTDVDVQVIAQQPGLQLLADSAEAGLFMVATADNRQIFITGHFEYDRNTLQEEYERDVAKGLRPALPEHYFPQDDPTKLPALKWHGAASLLFSNWLNYTVYQETVYDLAQLPKLEICRNE